MNGAHRRSRVPIIGIFVAICLATASMVAFASHKGRVHRPIHAAGSLRPSYSVSPPPISTVVGPELVPSKPVTIDIPAIGVHSWILTLGVNSNGSVTVPSGADHDRAGWYKYSATPGTVGAAVILGHVDSAAGGASVFADLPSLRPGNKVIVTRQDGVVAVFQITSVRSYPRDHFPTDVVYDNEDSAALRLITIGDSFSFFSRGQFVDSLIVSASLIDSHRG